MDKRDKVITGFMCLLSCTTPNDCSECGYECNTAIHVKTPVNMIFDAIGLLKAQEPKIVTNIHKEHNNVLNPNVPWVGKCPKCGKKIEGRNLTRFCKFCGQAVKWNERE